MELSSPGQCHGLGPGLQQGVGIRDIYREVVCRHLFVASEKGVGPIVA